GTPMEFNTIAISDGVTMGTEGMKASLVSREVIADSMELVGRGHMFDAMITLVGCDKTIPAGAMALIRLNVPGVLLYGGSIAAARDPGARGVRERDCQRCCDRRVNECSTAPARDGAGSRRPAHNRRFRSGQPAHSHHRRSKAGRPLRRYRRASRWRYSADCE